MQELLTSYLTVVKICERGRMRYGEQEVQPVGWESSRLFFLVYIKCIEFPTIRIKEDGSRRGKPEWICGKAEPPGVWRLVLCRHFGFPTYFGTSEMGLITQILNQLVDHQHRGPIHSPDELGAGGARA